MYYTVGGIQSALEWVEFSVGGIKGWDSDGSLDNHTDYSIWVDSECTTVGGIQSALQLVGGIKGWNSDGSLEY